MGGANWSVIYNNDNLSIDYITFVDNLNGWIISSNKIFYSKDGGLNWTEQYYNNKYCHLPKLFIVDESMGWIVDFDGKIYLK